MREPLFKNDDETTLLWTGTVERIDGNGIGWGEAKGIHESFDMPVHGFGVGSHVEFYQRIGADDHEYVCALFEADNSAVRLAFINRNDKGYEEVGSQVYTKNN